MAKNYDGPCPVERVFRVFGGKWKSAILFYLEEKGTLRFNELRKQIPEVTQRMLTQQLRELERDGLVIRKHYPEIPPRVEYSTTKLAASLVPIFRSIDEWGKKHMASIHKAQKRYDAKQK